LTSLDESFDIILHLFGLSCVPHIEELHFDVCEYLFRISQEL
jgi:hypothetical protein